MLLKQFTLAVCWSALHDNHGNCLSHFRTKGQYADGFKTSGVV